MCLLKPFAQSQTAGVHLNIKLGFASGDHMMITEPDEAGRKHTIYSSKFNSFILLSGYLNFLSDTYTFPAFDSCQLNDTSVQFNFYLSHDLKTVFPSFTDGQMQKPNIYLHKCQKLLKK